MQGVSSLRCHPTNLQGLPAGEKVPSRSQQAEGPLHCDCSSEQTSTDPVANSALHTMTPVECSALLLQWTHVGCFVMTCEEGICWQGALLVNAPGSHI